MPFIFFRLSSLLQLWWQLKVQPWMSESKVITVTWNCLLRLLHWLESNYTALCCRGIRLATLRWSALHIASLIYTSLHCTTIHYTKSQTNWSTLQSLLIIACSLPQFYILLQLSALNRRCSWVLRFVASSTLTSIHESPPYSKHFSSLVWAKMRVKLLKRKTGAKA